MAKVVGTVKGDWGFHHGESWRVWNQRIDRLYKKLDDRSQKIIASGEYIGALIDFPVADGKATYQIVRTKPLELHHVPFGDAYEANPILIRGLTLRDVKSMIARDRAVRRFFAKAEAEAE